MLARFLSHGVYRYLLMISITFKSYILQLSLAKYLFVNFGFVCTRRLYDRLIITLPT